ncbi:MAG: hypothetical protein WCQ44_13125, partial [Opitutaceae bacterium]
MIIGWGLLNNSIENQVLQFSRDKVDYFKQEKLIPENAKVGLALQLCLDTDFQGNGIIQKVYSYLETLTNDRFDVIEASVRKNNLAGIAITQNLRFNTILEDNIRFYKVKETNSQTVNKTIEELIFGDKSIVIRKGKIGDEIQLFELNKKWLDVNSDDNSKGFLTSLY